MNSSAGISIERPKVLTPALRMVLSLEVCERLGFYSLQSVLIIYLVESLRFSDDRAALLWGTVNALCYIGPAVGGWLGEKILGTRRAIIIALSLLLTGYAGLAIGAGSPTRIDGCLAVIAIGVGLFKPNIANLVHHIQKRNPTEFDVVFTYYYMAISIGSTAGLVAAPLVQHIGGTRAAFGLAAIGILISLTVLLGASKLLQHTPPRTDVGKARRSTPGWICLGIAAVLGAFWLVLQYPKIASICIAAVAAFMLGAWSFVYIRSNFQERKGLLILYNLLIQTMLFYIYNQQIGTSLTLFAARYVDPTLRIGNWHLFRFLPGQYQAFDTVWLIVMSPILATIYRWLRRTGRDVFLPVKYIVGFIFLSAAALVWWLGSLGVHGAGMSSWLMILAYWLFAIGELFVSALALAAVARYAPEDRSGLLMGTVFVSAGVGMYLGGILAAHLTGVHAGVTSLSSYQALFRNLFSIGAIAALISAVFLPLMSRWDRTSSLRGSAAQYAGS